MEAKEARVDIRLTPDLQGPTLLVSWQTRDFGKVASRVMDRLIEETAGIEVAEIKPQGFFSFGGVRFENDLVKVPESIFRASAKRNLLMLKSNEPEFEHYQFLTTLLEVAVSHYRVRKIYTLNGTLSLTAHTLPRKILAVFNQPELGEEVRAGGAEALTWEGPPALSSYLLWTARGKGIPAASLWLEVPFYLASGEDPQAIKTALSFLDRKFDLGLDPGSFDGEIRDQSERLSQLRKENVDVDRWIHLLETGETLEEEDQFKLTKEVRDCLSRGRG
jgi:predicted ATP-grasp superfamily ATP-dependent carboligase